MTEKLGAKKKQHLQKVKKELASIHPETIPASLQCCITQVLVHNPVISPSGMVYQRDQIERWLANHDLDPFRSPLKKQDLVSFPELNFYRETFEKQRSKYYAKKECLLDFARNADCHSNKLPQIFICSESKQPLKKAFITARGDLIDSTVLEKNSTLNALEFSEFNQYLNFYWSVQAKKSGNTLAASPSTHDSQVSYSIVNFLQTLFFSPSISAEEEKTTSEHKNNPPH